MDVKRTLNVSKKKKKHPWLSVKFEQVLICNIKENLFNSIFGFGFWIFQKKKNNLETEKKVTNNQTR